MPYVTADDGVRLHYDDWGAADAPAVLMIQGLGADKHGWDFQRYALIGRYRVIAFDNRGAGKSDKPPGPHTLERMAEDALVVLDACGVDKAHVIGASMGGVIAQMLFGKRPEAVRSLVLACTTCRNHPWRVELLTKWKEIALAKGMNRLAHEAARWVIGPRSFRRFLPMFGWLGPVAMGRHPQGFAAQIDGILAADETAARHLAEVNVPALVLVGNQDILTPRADSEELAELIPGAHLVVISGAAHGFMIEHASTFNRIIKDFFGRVGAHRTPTLATHP